MIDTVYAMIDHCIECYGSPEENLMKSCGGVWGSGQGIFLEGVKSKASPNGPVGGDPYQ